MAIVLIGFQYILKFKQNPLTAKFAKSFIAYAPQEECQGRKAKNKLFAFFADLPDEGGLSALCG
jgi:hypothetical protein